MPATAFALAPALSLRHNTLSRARRASRATIATRATSEVRLRRGAGACGGGERGQAAA